MVRRFLRQPAVLRRRRVVVWQGLVRVDMPSDNTTGTQIMQTSSAALLWAISFPWDVDVRSADDVVLTDEEYVPLVPSHVFEIANDGGPYTDQVVRVALAFETRNA
jgi:hypothetical protein